MLNLFSKSFSLFSVQKTSAFYSFVFIKTNARYRFDVSVNCIGQWQVRQILTIPQYLSKYLSKVSRHTKNGTLRFSPNALQSEASRKHAYIILTPFNPTFI